ncbi:hypothetical protein L484_027405 [Morus notabilis]|uniref:Uncharacterized protein n=1 Tax=Morus notabilis TaxID=981085 RepID=W9QUZ7_9ROSA|nr:hypothetical protein L484_027405 [Morus notabilis]
MRILGPSWSFVRARRREEKEESSNLVFGLRKEATSVASRKEIYKENHVCNRRGGPTSWCVLHDARADRAKPKVRVDFPLVYGTKPKWGLGSSCGGAMLLLTWRHRIDHDRDE